MIGERIDVRHQFIGNDFIQPPLQAKRDESDVISEQVERFLANGGYIRKIPVGTSSQIAVFKNEPVAMKPIRKARSQAAQRKEKMQSSRLGSGEAAKFLGISRHMLRHMSSRGEGPKFTQSVRGQLRFYYQRSDLENWKNARIHD